MDKVVIHTTVTFARSVPLAAYWGQTLTEAVEYEKDKSNTELIEDALQFLDSADENRIIISQMVTGQTELVD